MMKMIDQVNSSTRNIFWLWGVRPAYAKPSRVLLCKNQTQKQLLSFFRKRYTFFAAKWTEGKQLFFFEAQLSVFLLLQYYSISFYIYICLREDDELLQHDQTDMNTYCKNIKTCQLLAYFIHKFDVFHAESHMYGIFTFEQERIRINIVFCSLHFFFLSLVLFTPLYVYLFVLKYAVRCVRNERSNSNDGNKTPSVRVVNNWMPSCPRMRLWNLICTLLCCSSALHITFGILLTVTMNFPDIEAALYRVRRTVHSDMKKSTCWTGITSTRDAVKINSKCRWALIK